MRRFLLLLTGIAILALPAAAVARAQSHDAKPGFLVVRNALNDDGLTGSPVATIAVQGFVIGHIKQEGAVEIYRFGTGAAAQVSGVDISRDPVKWHGQAGWRFSGSDFRFRAVGGVWRVVAYGARISLYAGGQGRRVTLHGSVAYPRSDGSYSFNGAPFASLPSGTITRRLGGK